MRLTVSTGAVLLFTLCVPALPAASVSNQPEGVRHFFQVNQTLYRGAQPTEEGFKELAAMGVKTIIDLREEDNAAWEEPVVKAAGMRYINVPIAGLAAPTSKQMAYVLSVLNDKNAGPVFVHCKRGKDRTGAIVACYRISHDGWDNARALKEARNLGMSWFELPKQQFVLAFHNETNDSRPVIVPATVAAPVPVQ